MEESAVITEPKTDPKPNVEQIENDQKSCVVVQKDLSAGSVNDLNKKQRYVFDQLCTGKSIFLTGPGGAGKTFLIETYYRYACDNYGEYAVYKTSSTGVSACLINGKTLHSWAGIFLGEGTVDELLKNMKFTAINRWKNTKVLFIDEISMIKPELFDKLEEIGRRLKNNDKPFGSIQIIASGDFFQLPPVEKNSNVIPLCFKAKTWNNVISETIQLTDIIRQKDPIYQALLNEVRYGHISDSHSDILKSRVGYILRNDHGIIPTILYPKNIDVDTLNIKKLNELLSKEKKYVYTAKFSKFVDIKARSNKSIDTLYNNFKNDELKVSNTITLCKGAQIMFRKNINEMVANGTKGVVVDFATIKSTLGGITVKDNTEYPLVKLLNGVTIHVIPEDFEYKVKGEFTFVKKQLPIKLSWATTIHASQGSTLDYVIADIGSNIFAYGQVYVVLSRVKSIEGLSLISYDQNSIIANPEVLEFYQGI